MHNSSQSPHAFAHLADRVFTEVVHIFRSHLEGWVFGRVFHMIMIDSCPNLFLKKFPGHTVDKGGGGNSKKVNTHPKIPEIDLDKKFF